MLVFSQSEIKSHWRVLRKLMPRIDLFLDRVTLFCMLRIGCKEAGVEVDSNQLSSYYYNLGSIPERQLQRW
jgi:hypothetical protein